MQPLMTFACLSMCTAALTALLPERSGLRKTALLCSGLMLAALWLSCLPQLTPHIPSAAAPATWLAPADTEPIAQRQAALLKQMQEDAAHEQAADMASP